MRARRVEYAGAIYHVMQRGNNKEDIFRGDGDKRFFIAELANSKKMFDFQLFGYVLLDNHYHLFLQTGDKPLSKIMQRQNSLYSRYFNRVHERSGHLFGLRYKASVIPEERYLFAVLRYIHWNPVRAGIADSVSEYRWSSDYFYRNNIDGLVDIDFMLKILSENRNYARNEYLRLIQDGSSTESSEMDLPAEEPFDIFATRNRGSASESRMDLDDILMETGLNDYEFSLTKSGSRKRNLKPYKASYIREAYRQGYTYQEIADNISISASAALKLIE